MKKLLTVLTSLWLSIGVVVTYADTGSFSVTTPGPLASFAINTSIYNNDTFDLLRADFDSSSTTAIGGGGGPLVFGGLGSISNPSGGTSSFTQDSTTAWHFDFTSFNFGDSFAYGWDPDTASDSNYGATVGELAGLLVSLTTTGGVVSGTMQIVGETVSVNIPSPGAAVPEPATMLLLGSGLIGLVGYGRKKFFKK